MAHTEDRLIHLVWWQMINRCTNPEQRSYASYGGRGITVCDRWRSSYEHFLADMGPRPSRQHSIERIDNHGPYEPDNCRWATRQEQGANKRNNHNVTLNGRTQHLNAWARELNIDRLTLYMRIKRGWTPEAALTTPLQDIQATQFKPTGLPRKPPKPRPTKISARWNYVTFAGRTQRLSDWAKELGLPTQTLSNRIHRGWTLERALTRRP